MELEDIKTITLAFLLDEYPRFKPIAKALGGQHNLQFALKLALLEIYQNRGG